MIDRLRQYLGAYDRFTLFALIPILAVPFILDSVFGLQPPWPRSTTYLTAFLELGIVFFCFLQDRITKQKMRRIVFLSVLSMVALFAVYFLMYSLFVFTLPAGGGSIVGGFICKPDTQYIIAPFMNESCPFVSEQVLASAQYRPETVWEPLSIRIIEFALFSCWSLFFMVSTYLYGSFVAYISTRRSPIF